jgi:hypothetical protein
MSAVMLRQRVAQVEQPTFWGITGSAVLAGLGFLILIEVMRVGIVRIVNVLFDDFGSNVGSPREFLL